MMKLLQQLFFGVLVLVMLFLVTQQLLWNCPVRAQETCRILTPTDKSLVAAGYITITWNEATGGAVKNYDVYIDGKKCSTQMDTTYEYYTTEVAYHTAYIKVNYQNGTDCDTGKITFGVSKKGLAVDLDMGRNLDPNAFRAVWYYNWREYATPYSSFLQVEHVPMIWKSTNGRDFLTRIESQKNNGYKYVLTFNEPEDFVNQCNMTVDEVRTVWKSITDVEGIQVSAPVTALWPKISTEWFQPFMNFIRQDGSREPDFISLHCYPENAQGVSMAQFFLKDVVDWTWETYHKPIWITEFSTHGEYVTSEGTAAFWRAVMPELDKREYVVRYSAFGFDAKSHPGYGLWDYEIGELSQAGTVYAQYGNPTVMAAQSEPETLEHVSQTTTVQKKKNLKPARVKIASVKKKKRAGTVIIRVLKTVRAQGYQVRYSTKRKFHHYKTKNSSKRQIVLRKFSRHKTYYIKIRAYNDADTGSRKYGKWSKTKKIAWK